jgi:glycosyltransferase involved in cell wall biosynthesis
MRRIVLILMVKNESRILLRCLEAVKGVVDAYCITDTGSTDTTCEIANAFLETHAGRLHECEWENFGVTRTASFRAAKEYVESQGWDLTETYGLLLDGDMVFVPGTLKDYPLTSVGYTIVQCAGTLEYPNCRLVRMDRDWVCKGATHEYWDGPATAIPKEVCRIDDRNDGGCKSDKFERDIRLLTEGLEKEPDNIRYMFYLAQSYHSTGKWKDCIAMYKKRIAAGGWFEEVWYSHYMIAQTYLQLGDAIRFEAWMLRAYQLRPERAEPLYKLAKHFRESSQHYKAYHYAKLGATKPIPSDTLFIEKDVYDGLFEYEMTILDYYVNGRGLPRTVDYLLKTNNSNVFANMCFYVKPIGGGTPFPAPRDLFGPDFHPGSVCVWKANGKMHANVRYVNYRLDPATRNTYEMCENGEYSTNHTVKTENAYMCDGAITRMNDASITLTRRPVHIRGLEDVRVFKRGSGLWFTATTLEYSEKIRILTGRYCPETAEYTDCTILQSPTAQSCEKNWLGIPLSRDMIYRWHPFQVGCVEGDTLDIHTTHPTPAFFGRMRGSAGPLLLDDEYWVMTHVVEYSAPRKYYHMFVILDAKTYEPKRMSLPFVFEQASVEYCLGICIGDVGIDCVYSTMDDNPRQLTIPFNRLEWVKV